MQRFETEEASLTNEINSDSDTDASNVYTAIDDRFRQRQEGWQLWLWWAFFYYCLTPFWAQEEDVQIAIERDASNWYRDKLWQGTRAVSFVTLIVLALIAVEPSTYSGNLADAGILVCLAACALKGSRLGLGIGMTWITIGLLDWAFHAFIMLHFVKFVGLLILAYNVVMHHLMQTYRASREVFMVAYEGAIPSDRGRTLVAVCIFVCGSVMVFFGMHQLRNDGTMKYLDAQFAIDYLIPELKMSTEALASFHSRALDGELQKDDLSDAEAAIDNQSEIVTHIRGLAMNALTAKSASSGAQHRLRNIIAECDQEESRVQRLTQAFQTGTADTSAMHTFGVLRTNMRSAVMPYGARFTVLNGNEDLYIWANKKFGIKTISGIIYLIGKASVLDTSSRDRR